MIMKTNLKAREANRHEQVERCAYFEPSSEVVFSNLTELLRRRQIIAKELLISKSDGGYKMLIEVFDSTNDLIKQLLAI
jgi:hypothetical protein